MISTIFRSSPRKRGPRATGRSVEQKDWIPACAGMSGGEGTGQNLRPSLRSVFATAAIVLSLVAPAAAEDYPAKPVRLIIPFPPGGSNDVVGRMIATAMSERLGKQVVVDN